MKDNRKLIYLAILCASIASTAYLLMLGWFNHLQLDDYGFVVDAENMGIFGMAKHMYMTWECRFSAMVVQNILNVTIGRMSNIILLTILQLLFAYVSIQWLYKYIFNLKDKFITWNLAIITANVAIMSYFELSTFYWLSAAWYNLPIFTTICLVVLLFYSTAPLFWRWCGVLLCSLYLTGCPENYVPIVIFCLACCFVYMVCCKKQYAFWKDTRTLMLFVTLVLLIAGMLSMILGPGNKVRMATMGETDTNLLQHLLMPSYFVKSVKAMAIFSVRLFSRCLYYILLVPIFMYVGYWIKQNNTKLEWFTWKSIGWLTLIIFVLLLLTIVISVYGLGWYAPLRSYCFVSFLMAFYSVAIGICLGGIIQRRTINVCGIVLSSIITIIMSCYFIFTEYPLVKNYSNQIFSLQKEIKIGAETERSTPLYVSKITYPATPNTYAILRREINKMRKRGMTSIPEPNTYAPYMIITLSQDPNNFVNKGMQMYFGADFEIIGWETK